MMNRRDLHKGLGLLAVGAFGASQARAKSTPYVYAPGPHVPWTKTDTLRRAGGQLAYATLGPENSGKPPIVLLHRLGGWMADWRHVAPALAHGRRVVLFDLPGHGGSRWSGPVPYIQTLSESAALLVGAFDELGMDRVDLIGTSLGGCIGVPLAAHFPERVNKLALVSSALGGKRTLAEIAVAIDARQNQAFYPDGMPKPFEAALLTKTFGIVHADEIAREGNASRHLAGLWNQPSERGVAITDVRGLLKRVEAPTLLLYGALDPDYIKFREGAEANLKHSRTAYVPAAGAFVMQDNPAATAAILADFIENG